MSFLPLAHFGHWYVSLVFAAPPFVIVAYLLGMSLRDRVRQRRQRDEPQHRREDDG